MLQIKKLALVTFVLCIYAKELGPIDALFSMKNSIENQFKN